jgi:transcription antitermination factor NusG
VNASHTQQLKEGYEVPEKEMIYSGWHIVLCEPNRELTAVSGMTARGFRAMCPADYIRRKTGRKDQAGRPVLSVEPTPKAMIPGYAFVQFKGKRDYDGVKAVPGVRGFHFMTVGEGKERRYGVLTEREVQDLRVADELNFAKFQQSMLPKSKRKPDVEFETGKAVRFTTKFGREIYGQMMQKKGGGMVKVVSDHISYVVAQLDLMEMEKAS